jgi:phosphatidylethanolamine-binding protein (PEBP) family uncharacterized protein
MKTSNSIGLMVVALCILALAFAGCLSAQPDSSVTHAKNNETRFIPLPGPQTDTPGFPPDAAIAACSGKTTGDTCQFTDRNGVASGQCDDKPGVLACAPSKEQNSGQMPGEKTTPVSSVTRAVTLQPSSTLAVTSSAGGSTGAFSLTSSAGPDGGTLPAEYSCSGAGATPALSWSGAPAGTKEFALMVTTIPVDGSTRWNWVLYGIPVSATGLDRNSKGIGTVGTGSHGTVMQYDPPCPQGPGAKTYTFTLYALSASPSLPASADQVTGEVLTRAISSITLDKASFNLIYSSS